MDYKPDGYPDLSPYLLVTDAQAALDFMAAAFDAPALRIMHRDDGTIMHAEAQFGDSVVMLGQIPDATPAHVHLYMADPDAALARAIDAGGTQVQAMTEQGDGDRRGGVCAPDGTTWWLSRQVDP